MNIRVKDTVWNHEKKEDLARIFEWAQLPGPSFFISAAAALPSKPLPQRILPSTSRLVTTVTEDTR